MDHNEHCPHCGSTEWAELVAGDVNGIVAEADYFCKGCRRHLWFYAYGSWLPGSGPPMTADVEAKIERASRNLVRIQRTEAA